MILFLLFSDPSRAQRIAADYVLATRKNVSSINEKKKDFGLLNII